MLTVRVKVAPRSSASEVAGMMADGTLKVRLAAVPEKGKANAELCRVLAKHYRVGSRCCNDFDRPHLRGEIG